MEAKLASVLFEYDEVTGGLTWRSRDVGLFKSKGAWTTWNKRFAGKPAFTAKHIKGYLCGNAMGSVYLAHRVIWALKTGEWPKDQIDHINGKRDDNRWINLREVTNKENRKNQAVRVDSESGIQGVSVDKRTGLWRASITVDGRKITAHGFQSPEEAELVRVKMKVALGFHENHGRKRGD